MWREKVVFWAVFGKEFHLNDKWCFADRKEKRKELSGSISDEQILAGRSRDLSSFDAVCYLSRTPMVPSVFGNAEFPD